MIPPQPPLPRTRPIRRLLLALALLTSPLPATAQAGAAPAAPASLSGRVLNEATARYVNNARIAVKGTAHETFTDAGGAYLLEGLAPGPVTIVASFTNTAPVEKSITLVPGQRTELDLTLAASGASVVRLDEFRVNAARETDAESISTNEQRYSRNLKNVTSTDSLGEIAQNNIGEFIKYLPGVGVEYQGSDIIRINVRGLSSDKTEVTSDGLGEASVFADERENTRAPRLTQSSTVGIARIEVRKVPLPSDSASASFKLPIRSACTSSTSFVRLHIVSRARRSARSCHAESAALPSPLSSMDTAPSIPCSGFLSCARKEK